MPVHGEGDHHSAHGIIAELGSSLRALVATCESPQPALLGCVLGCILDQDLIASYGLDDFGAHPDDGLLAYIAVTPAAQGSRTVPLEGSRYEVKPPAAEQLGSAKGDSLAGTLFSKWLELADIRSCPRTFIRTREVIGPILHLIEKHRFEYHGKFELEFHGERQDRLIFARDGHSPPPPSRR